MEIQNKLTVTRGEEEGDNGRKKGKCCQGTCIKNTWTKPEDGGIEGGRWVLVEQERVAGRKWRQLYSNNNKKRKIINKMKIYPKKENRHEHQSLVAIQNLFSTDSEDPYYW